MILLLNNDKFMFIIVLLKGIKYRESFTSILKNGTIKIFIRYLPLLNEVNYGETSNYRQSMPFRICSKSN